MKKPIAHFRRTNWSGYSCFVKGCGTLMVWFAPEMSWFAAPNGNAGHPGRVPTFAIRVGLSLRVLFRLPLRQNEPGPAIGSKNRGEGASTGPATAGSGARSISGDCRSESSPADSFPDHHAEHRGCGRGRCPVTASQMSGR